MHTPPRLAWALPPRPSALAVRLLQVSATYIPATRNLLMGRSADTSHGGTSQLRALGALPLAARVRPGRTPRLCSRRVHEGATEAILISMAWKSELRVRSSSASMTTSGQVHGATHAARTRPIRSYERKKVRPTQKPTRPAGPRVRARASVATSSSM
eukprot:5917431-Prymnesium_polylepis.1